MVLIGIFVHVHCALYSYCYLPNDRTPWHDLICASWSASCMAKVNQLSYRRETARQLRTSFLARSLIVHFTEHRICCTAIIDYSYKLVSTLSANKPSPYEADEAFKHNILSRSYVFVITRKPLRAFIIIHITYYKRRRLHTSRYVRDDVVWCVPLGGGIKRNPR